MTTTPLTQKKSRVAETVRNLPPSGIREFFDLVLTMDDIVSLGVGEPDFSTPWTITEAAVYSLERGRTSYTSNWGLLDLRKEIAKYLRDRFNADFDPEREILPTVGVSQGYDLILRAMIEPGDEVIIPQPSYVAYSPLVLLAGGVPVILETHVEDNFAVRVEAIETLVTERTKALVLNYPCNPTGATLDRDTLAGIAKLAAREGFVVLSDEIYAELTYEGEHTAFASLPQGKQNSVLLSGFSKAWAMTGWRVGYLAGPPDLIGAALRIHQYSMLSCPIMAQYAAIEALRNGEAPMRAMVDTYNQRRRVIVDGMNDAGLPCRMPEGAFYAFPSIKSTGLTSADFCKRLLQQERVALVPGSAFGAAGEGYVRCAYAASFEKIEAALAGVRRFLARL